MMKGEGREMRVEGPGEIRNWRLRRNRGGTARGTARV